MKVCRLSAAQEVQLGQEAGRAFAFLCGLAGEGMDRTRREQLWAVANNAALLRFSLKEGAYPVFDSAGGAAAPDGAGTDRPTGTAVSAAI